MRTPLSAYSAQEFADNCRNEFSRYYNRPDLCAHVLIENTDNGATPAIQYAFPDDLADASMVGHLEDIKVFDLSNGESVVHAKHGDTDMTSRRRYQFKIKLPDQDEKTFTYYPLSPQKKRPLGYNSAPIKRFKDNVAVQLTAQMTTLEGGWLSVKGEDIPKRVAAPRVPDQPVVTGIQHIAEATEALTVARNFIDEPLDSTPVKLPKAIKKRRPATQEVSEYKAQNEEDLTPEMLFIISLMISAPFRPKDCNPGINYLEANQFYPEILHKRAYNLHDMESQPQQADNMAVSQKRYNTQMLISERVAQFFALKFSVAKCKIKGKFALLPKSKIIDHIDHTVVVEVGGATITFSQSIDTFERVPKNASPTDLATIIGLFHFIIQNKQPLSAQGIKRASFVPTIFRSIADHDKKPDEEKAPVQTHHADFINVA